MPIIQALASGLVDRRYNVRRACADAISTTLLDRHANVVPACVLLDIFVDVIFPAVIAVGQFHVSAVQDGTYHLICNEIPETQHNKISAVATYQHDDYQHPKGFSVDHPSSVETIPVNPQNDPSPRDAPPKHYAAPPKRLGSKGKTGSIAGDVLSAATKVLKKGMQYSLRLMDCFRCFCRICRDLLFWTTLNHYGARIYVCLRIFLMLLCRQEEDMTPH